MRPERYRFGVVARDVHGQGVALGFARSLAEAEAIKASAPNRYSDVTIVTPAAEREVPDRLARRSSCGIEWEG